MIESGPRNIDIDYITDLILSRRLRKECRPGVRETTDDDTRITQNRRESLLLSGPAYPVNRGDIGAQRDGDSEYVSIFNLNCSFLI